MADKKLFAPHAVRYMWIGFVAILVLLVVAELAVARHPHFEFDSVFGFNALFGFFGGLAILIGSKMIGVFLKQPDTFYDDAE